MISGVSSAVKIGVCIPASPYVAIDYQLNWMEKCLNNAIDSQNGETVQDVDLPDCIRSG